jgi:hypothetical protein
MPRASRTAIGCAPRTTSSDGHEADALAIGRSCTVWSTTSRSLTRAGLWIRR